MEFLKRERGTRDIMVKFLEKKNGVLPFSVQSRWRCFGVTEVLELVVDDRGGGVGQWQW